MPSNNEIIQKLTEAKEKIRALKDDQKKLNQNSFESTEIKSHISHLRRVHKQYKENVSWLYIFVTPIEYELLTTHTFSSIHFMALYLTSQRRRAFWYVETFTNTTLLEYD